LRFHSRLIYTFRKLYKNIKSLVISIMENKSQPKSLILEFLHTFLKFLSLILSIDYYMICSSKLLHPPFKSTLCLEQALSLEILVSFSVHHIAFTVLKFFLHFWFPSFFLFLNLQLLPQRHCVLNLGYVGKVGSVWYS